MGRPKFEPDFEHYAEPSPGVAEALRLAGWERRVVDGKLMIGFQRSPAATSEPATPEPRYDLPPDGRLRVCRVCGKILPNQSNAAKYHRKYCSSKCRQVANPRRP